MGGQGSGRPRFKSYKRRTNAQIEADKRRLLSISANSLCDMRSTPSHESVTNVTSSYFPTATTISTTQNQGHNHQTQEIRQQHQQHEDEQVKTLNQVPKMFRSKVAKVLGLLKPYLSMKHKSDMTASKEWPFPDLFTHNWPSPHSQLNPQAVDFLLPKFCRLYFFFPDVFFRHLLVGNVMPCAFHGKGATCVCRDSPLSPNGPRIIHEADGGLGYLFTTKFTCKTNKDAGLSYCFHGHDPDVIVHYPSQIRDLFGYVLTRRRGISTTLMDDLMVSIPAHSSFAGFASQLKEKSKMIFIKVQHQYISHVTSPMHHKSILSHLSNENSGITETLLRNSEKFFPTEIGEVMPYGFISESTLKVLYSKRLTDLLPWYERQMQQISGSILKADKSYKVVKFIYHHAGPHEHSHRNSSSTRAYDSLYTVMNEHNQVAAVRFSLSGDDSEMEQLLKDLSARYEKLGFEDVRVFYTDNCCHEYNMISKCFPRLVDNRHNNLGYPSTSSNTEERFPIPVLEQDVDNVQLMQLPLSWIPDTLQTYQQVVTFCDAINQEITNLPSADASLNIGFDVEWDSALGALKTPRICQLATANGTIAVIQLGKVFGAILDAEGASAHNCLQSILTNFRVRLVGVGVTADITRLMKFPYAELLFGSSGDIKRLVVDLAVEERKVTVKHPGINYQGYYSLDSICRRHLHLKLNKSAVIRCSTWSEDRLTVEQIKYAALDAYSSALVSHKVLLFVQSFRKPTESDLVPGTFVRLTANSSNDVIAFGTVVGEVIDPNPYNVGRRRKFSKTYNIKLIKIRVKGALCPSGVVMKVYKEGECTKWPIHRIMLSSEEEQLFITRIIEHTRATNVDISHANNHNIATDTPMHCEENFADVLISVQYPDGETINDYPDSHKDEDEEENDEMKKRDNREEDSIGVTDCTGTDWTLVRVKLDPFHAIDRMKRTLKKKHGMYNIFCALIRDAMFTVNKDDLERQIKSLATNFDSAHPYLSGNALRKCRRHVPNPRELETRLQRVVSTCANVQDFRTAESLFSKETWAEYEKLLIHIRNGCLSDPQDVNLYYAVANSDGKIQLYCARGTSQLEGFHSHIRNVLSSYHSSPYLATLIMAAFIYRWNVDRAVERGLIEKQYGGFYNQHIIEEMQVMTKNCIDKGLSMNHRCILNLNEAHANFRSTADYENTGESFFSPWIKYEDDDVEDVEGTDSDDNDDGTEISSYDVVDDYDISPTMKFEAERIGRSWPTTKVMKCEQWLFDELLLKCARNRSKTTNCDVFTSVDFCEMTRLWNDRVSVELTMWKEKIHRKNDIDSKDMKKIFFKTAPVLKEHWKKYQDWENQKKAMNSVNVETGIKVSDTVNNVISTLHSTGSHVFQVANRVQLAERPLPQQVDSQRIRYPVAVPPIQVNTAYSTNIKSTVQSYGHIISSKIMSVTPQLRQASTMTLCRRCGNWRELPAHNSLHGATNVPSNSAEYCRVDETQYRKNWISRPGFNVGEQIVAKKKENTTQTVRWFRNHLQSNGWEITHHSDLFDHYSTLFNKG